MPPIGSEEMIRECLRVMGRVLDARGVSYFQPRHELHPASHLLLHEGGERVPELSDRNEAESFLRGLGASPPPWRASRAEHGWLVRVPDIRPVFREAGSWPERRERRSSGDEPANGPAASRDAWIGLALTEPWSIEQVLARVPVLEAGRGGSGSTGWWSWMIGVVGTLSWHHRRVSALLNDSISGLPGRAAFQAVLQQTLQDLQGSRGELTLILVNPDEFESVNRRWGREAGDRVVREIAERLSSCVRVTERPFRYGGAIFALAIPSLDQDAAGKVSDKILAELSRAEYLNEGVRLTFSLGVGRYAPDPSEPAAAGMLQLIRRADHALYHAKNLGGNRVVLWQDGMHITPENQRDRLTGIFTADPARDYRNMLLLWETVRAVSARIEEFEELAPRILERLAVTFRASWTGIVESSDAGLRVAAQGAPGAGAREAPVPPEVIREACLLGGVVQRRTGPDRSRRVVAVPLIVGDDYRGALCLEGQADELRPDSPDTLLLEGLAGHLALAVHRSRLAAAERARQKREQCRLESEVRKLREALGRTELIHGSPAMDRVLDTARRAASTDATVLVSGESGTGKELVARMIHELSPRRDKPLVVVDCGAIANNLLESELFGHERGAYTGADRATTGRIKEAEGGTVLLDEIGELPLELQSKLLRFVQEKQLTPVGGTQARTVDVRLIAATNRDLAGDVRAGRFREDLYYRLKVVHLAVPPLRERKEEILPLAHHFATQFSRQYDKALDRFSPEAESALVRHDWPGNVRELRNRILQAVVLSDGTELTPELVGLAREADLPGKTEKAIAPSSPPVAVTDPVSSNGDPWEALRQALSRRIDGLAAAPNSGAVPIGKWVEEDLVLAAHAAAEGVASRGAESLGIPETTYRRRLKKAVGKEQSGLSTRSGDWGEVRSILERALDATLPAEADLIERARGLILGLLAKRLDGDVRRGAALMGVTEPTYRRWSSRNAEPEPVGQCVEGSSTAW